MRSMVALLVAASLSLPALSQNPIQVDVNLVDVAFTARDSRGALIASLTKPKDETIKIRAKTGYWSE